MPPGPLKPLMLCFSHLRWDFVFQRPQHLLSRAAATYRVVFLEEPVHEPSGAGAPRLARHVSPEGVMVVTPVLPEDWSDARRQSAQRGLLDALLHELGDPAIAVAWYYTPMALGFAGHLRPEVTVFDCMDELSAFHGASPALLLLERRLMQAADLVFTGGRSLHAAKQALHPRVHLFASGVDTAHFGQARAAGHPLAEPDDQQGIPRPRIGWFGVIDERMDIRLLHDTARLRPDWSFVMLGPVVKIDPATLPRAPNIHWLGMKAHTELPSYLAGWDAGLMPFALNEATRFISPTKTPEYLAAGLSVVSTSVPDVVAAWGDGEMVSIADTPEAVVLALARAMERPDEGWWARADEKLAAISWDGIWASMLAHIREAATRADETEGERLPHV